jgi:hypothetical protein
MQNAKTLTIWGSSGFNSLSNNSETIIKHYSVNLIIIIYSQKTIILESSIERVAKKSVGLY